MGIFHVPLLVGYFSVFSSFHLVQIAVSGVGFLYSAGLWFLFIVKILPSGWGWTIGLSRFLVREACVSVLVCGNGFLLSGVQWSAQ